MTEIQPLSFDPDGPKVGFEIREERQYGFSATKRQPTYRVTLWNDGFEASKTGLTLDDLGTIRDWLNDTINARKQIKSAEAMG